MSENKIYIAIDLKSFYASVECVARGLDPLTTNLVVADSNRTEKTICLATSPSLKEYGIKGRPRLFEVEQKLNEVNRKRKEKIYNRQFTHSSYNANELKNHPEYFVDYLVAKPRMSYYIEVSRKIYEIYLKYIAAEDMHVYSIDEVFMDVTDYLKAANLSAYGFAMQIIKDVYSKTGITATGGIGTNLYLCKVAMDIVAKHKPADKQGVRIAQLDEKTYRKLLWNHKPLIDFWRIGKGYEKKLNEYGLYTMGDIAKCSLQHENLLYKMFGINAELLIDHAWGWEPCTMKMIKEYKPASNSLGSAQILHEPYSYEKCRLVVKEMAESLSLELFEKCLVSDQISLIIGYDSKNLNDESIKELLQIKKDFYGREVPKSAHGTIHIKRKTSSTKLITEATLSLYDKIVNSKLLMRRISITALDTQSEASYSYMEQVEQIDLFTDLERLEKENKEEDRYLKKEKKVQEAILKIKKRYGKNSIIKVMDLEEGATAKERNNQIGGHRS